MDDKEDCLDHKNNNTTKHKRAWLTASKLSLMGKALAILGITVGMTLSLIGIDIDMDTLKAGAWTLALIGSPIDASHVVQNLVSPWTKK